MRHSVLYLCCGGGERGLGWRELGQDVGGAGGPDERLGIDVVMGDVLIARRGSATLVKLLRRMRVSVMSVMSVMSRRRRSTIFSHGALVGVKCMTRRGCRANETRVPGQPVLHVGPASSARRAGCTWPSSWASSPGVSWAGG